MPLIPPIIDIAPRPRSSVRDPSLDWAGGRDEGPEALDLGALLRRILRGWWIVGLGFLVAVGLATVWLRVTPPLYTSVATVRVEQERRPLLPSGESGSGAEDMRSLEVVKTIEQALVSQNNLWRVVGRMRLAEDESFSNDRTEAGLLGALSGRIGAGLRRGTRLIDVVVEDTDPVRARDIAAAVVEEFIDASSQEAMAGARAKAGQLRDNVSRLEARIRETQGTIQDYREENRGLPLDKEGSVPAEKVRELSARLAQVVAERTRLDAARAEIAALGPNPDVDAVLKVQGVAAGEDITALKTALAQKEAEFDRLRQRYLPRHPKYLHTATELDSLRRQVASLGARAASTLAAASAQLTATERGLREEIAQAESDALAVERAAGPYRLLLAQLASDQASFDALQAELKLAEVAEVASPAGVVLTDAPLAATRPSKPKKKLVLALAGLLGGLGGLGVVLLGAVVRRGYDSAEEIEKDLRLPALAVVPRSGVSLRSLALLDNPGVERTCGQAFRTLNSTLSLLNRGRDVRSVVFLSATTGEGTSFVAANHALALARQGYRTLLIDANLYDPWLDQVFFAGRNVDGLANYLEGRAASGHACRPTHVSELFLLSAGRPARHPSEVMQPGKLELLFQDATRWFHRIVIDAPALDRAHDGLVLGQAADQVVLVVNGRTATRRASGAACRRLALAGVQPVGFIANECAGGPPPWQPVSDPLSCSSLSLRTQPATPPSPMTTTSKT